MIGDHLSPEANWKIRVRVSLSILVLYTITVIQVNRGFSYGFIGLPITIAWFVGLTLFDHQEFEKRTRRASARVLNFAMNYGMSPDRLASLSGGSSLRPDPHPAGPRPDPNVTPIVWDAENHVWIANPNVVNRVERISVGGKYIKFKEKTTIRLTYSIRISRYKRIADPAKWVI